MLAVSKPAQQVFQPLYRSKDLLDLHPLLGDELFKLIERIWKEEVVPVNLAIAKFIMLYKQKGSANDPKKYRCIGLLNHEYKLLSGIILARMLHASDGFLQEMVMFSYGFRVSQLIQGLMSRFLNPMFRLSRSVDQRLQH